MALPPVTVCVPTHRRPQLLKRALESVTQQTYGGPLSCVISDNAQQSEVTAIVEELRDSAPDIEWVDIQSPEVVSPVENWRRAVSAAKTEWVKILWDDDWMEPRFLEQTVKEALALKVSAVTTAARVISPDGATRLLYDSTPKLKMPPSGDVLRRYSGILPALPVSPAAALLRRDSVLEAIDSSEALGPCFESAMGPDLVMILGPALQGSLAHLPEVLVNFWAGRDSITITSNELRLRLCYDRAMLLVAESRGIELPRDVKRRLQHRAFLAWAQREPNQKGLLSPRPSLTRLVHNVWDRRSRLLSRVWTSKGAQHSP